jgi:hypothetical protein
MTSAGLSRKRGIRGLHTSPTLFGRGGAKIRTTLCKCVHARGQQVAPQSHYQGARLTTRVTAPLRQATGVVRGRRVLTVALGAGYRQGDAQ